MVEKRAVRVTQPACSIFIGLDVDSLPPDIGIIDVDNSVAALAFLVAHLREEDGLIVKKTPGVLYLGMRP